MTRVNEVDPITVQLTTLVRAREEHGVAVIIDCLALDCFGTSNVELNPSKLPLQQLLTLSLHLVHILIIKPRCALYTLRSVQPVHRHGQVG